MCLCSVYRGSPNPNKINPRRTSAIAEHAINYTRAEFALKNTSDFYVVYFCPERQSSRGSTYHALGAMWNGSSVIQQSHII